MLPLTGSKRESGDDTSDSDRPPFVTGALLYKLVARFGGGRSLYLQKQLQEPFKDSTEDAEADASSGSDDDGNPRGGAAATQRRPKQAAAFPVRTPDEDGLSMKVCQKPLRRLTSCFDAWIDFLETKNVGGLAPAATSLRACAFEFEGPRRRPRTPAEHRTHVVPVESGKGSGNRGRRAWPCGREKSSAFDVRPGRCCRLLAPAATTRGRTRSLEFSSS